MTTTTTTPNGDAAALAIINGFRSLSEKRRVRKEDSRP